MLMVANTLGFIANALSYSKMIDLIQDGIIGLNTAADRFNPNKDCKFSSYAYGWIQHNIRHAIATKSRAIRVSQEVDNLLGKIYYARERLMEKGENPTPDKIAADLNVDIQKIKKVLAVNYKCISIYTYIGESHGQELIDILPADTPDVGEIIDQSWVREKVEEAIGLLNPMERQVISMRFGFDGEPAQRLQIAEKVGKSRERVRQIEIKALEKLKEYLR